MIETLSAWSHPRDAAERFATFMWGATDPTANDLELLYMTPVGRTAYSLRILWEHIADALHPVLQWLASKLPSRGGL